MRNSTCLRRDRNSLADLSGRTRTVTEISSIAPGRVDAESSTPCIYSFGEGRAEGGAALRDLLGGKGAGLAEMTNAGVPVPPGFTITTDVCRYYYANKQKLPKELEAQQKAAMDKLQKSLKKGFGDPPATQQAGVRPDVWRTNPLLVSVRSGAKFSM